MSTRTQVEKTIVDHQRETTSYSAPKELYGVHLIPSQETHTYTNPESSDSNNKVEDDNVAAIVHGNLIVVGQVINVPANPLAPQADVNPSSTQITWHEGGDSHRDTHSLHQDTIQA